VNFYPCGDYGDDSIQHMRYRRELFAEIAGRPSPYHAPTKSTKKRKRVLRHKHLKVKRKKAST
jgi:hypothetical protein